MCLWIVCASVSVCVSECVCAIMSVPSWIRLYVFVCECACLWVCVCEPVYMRKCVFFRVSVCTRMCVFFCLSVPVRKCM